MANALVRTARAAHTYRGTAVAIALLREALNVLSDEDVEAELRAADRLPRDVKTALEDDDRDLATVLTSEV
jgi:hypothetical protein